MYKTIFLLFIQGRLPVVAVKGLNKETEHQLNR